MFPKFRNNIPYESLEKVSEFRPIDVVDKIAPRAFCLLSGADDTTADPASAKALIDAAGEPKRWICYEECGHFDYWLEPLFSKMMDDSINFFNEHIANT